MGLFRGIVDFCGVWIKGTAARPRGQLERAALRTARQGAHAKGVCMYLCLGLRPGGPQGMLITLLMRSAHHLPPSVSGGIWESMVINHLFNQSELIKQARVGRARLGLGLGN